MSEVPLYAGSVSLGLIDYFQVDMLGFRYKFVNFGEGKNPGSLDQ